jgi:hypothetical protein
LKLQTTGVRFVADIVELRGDADGFDIVPSSFPKIWLISSSSASDLAREAGECRHKEDEVQLLAQKDAPAENPGPEV